MRIKASPDASPKFCFNQGVVCARIVIRGLRAHGSISGWVATLSKHVCESGPHPPVPGRLDTKSKPKPVGPALSELFIKQTGSLPSAICVSASIPWEEPGRLKQSSGIKLGRTLPFPRPHWPRRVHQGLTLILILFKRGKSDSTVSSEAIYTPPPAIAPSSLCLLCHQIHY